MLLGMPLSMRASTTVLFVRSARGAERPSQELHTKLQKSVQLRTETAPATGLAKPPACT